MPNMNFNLQIFLVLLTGLFCFSARGSFTKLDAASQLKQTGLKWRMTESLVSDARAKEEFAEASFNPKLALVFREYYAKINPVQFGGASDIETLNQAAFGTTALEVNWTLLDSLAKAELLLAKNAAHTSEEKRNQLQSDLSALMFFQYLNVQRLERQIGMMNSNLAKSELIYKLAQAKKNVGAGIDLDIARARTLFELDRIKKIVALNKLQKAKHELATTLGIEKISQELEPLNTRRIKVTDVRGYLEKSYLKRSDLKTARSDLETAHTAVAYTSGWFFPKFSLIGELGSTQASLLGLPAKTINGFIGASLTIPLDTGGIIRSKKMEAASAENKALLQTEQTRLEILQQVKESLEQILSAEEALNASEEYVKTVHEESLIAEGRYREGLSNILDFTSAHANLTSAEDTLTESIFNYESAKLNYFHVQGSMDDYVRSLTE